jgi:serine/threonine-protein kinase
MQPVKRRSSHLRRAALLGVAAAAVAHLPPLHIAQHLNSALLDAWTGLPGNAQAEIVIVDLGHADAVTALASLGRRDEARGLAVAEQAGPPVKATVIGPTAIALGPVSVSPWVETAAWAFALAALLALATRRSKSLAPYWLLGIGGTGVLLLTSGTAFAMGATWVPVAGPSLMLLTASALALLEPNRLLEAPVWRREQPESASAYLRRGELEAAWEEYRERPVTAALLPELYALGLALESGGYPALAVDTYLRIAIVAPDFEDVTRRLVRAGRRGGADDGELEALRATMPSRIGRYRLLEPIGRGMSGQVYLARDPKINRLVAIKLIDLTLERDEAELADATERFRREVETTGRLSHKNIVTIFDMGESKGRAYIAMEYLKGDLLSRFTTKETLLPPKLVLELGALTADALDYAHSQNVIHRDIKPGNIMYDSVSGDLKITDFGIARLIDVNRTRTGIVLGTPSFMSPEQIEGGNVNGHTDLFALGVSLYELLTGQLPFRGASMTNLMFVIANEPHERVTAARRELPIDVDTIIDTALSKDPGARYQRGADMAEALRVVTRRMA